MLNDKRMTVHKGGRSVVERLYKGKMAMLFTSLSDTEMSYQSRFTMFAKINPVQIEGCEVMPLTSKPFKMFCVLKPSVGCQSRLDPSGLGGEGVLTFVVAAITAPLRLPKM